MMQSVSRLSLIAARMETIVSGAWEVITEDLLLLEWQRLPVSVGATAGWCPAPRPPNDTAHRCSERGSNRRAKLPANPTGNRGLGFSAAKPAIIRRNAGHALRRAQTPYRSSCDAVSQFLRCRIAVLAMLCRNCCDAASHTLGLAAPPDHCLACRAAVILGPRDLQTSDLDEQSRGLTLGSKMLP